MNLLLLSRIGGIFAVFTLAHFCVDWCLQSEWEARNKTRSGWIRALHSTIYSVPFVLIIHYGIRYDWPHAVANGLFCFVTHWIEDTYRPVWLWFKYVRRVPDIRSWDDFKRLVRDNPFYQLLAIVVDQVIHLLVLFGIAVAVADLR